MKRYNHAQRIFNIVSGMEYLLTATVLMYNVYHPTWTCTILARQKA